MPAPAAAPPSLAAGTAPLPGLRRDAPGRREYARGRVPDLDTAEARELAKEALLADVYAASARQSITSRLATAKVLLAQWDLTPIPISADVVLALGASLKAGGYRSAALYLSAVKVHSERQGFITSNVVERLIKDTVRSCERGQGAPKQAAALPLERLHLLPSEDSPWVEGGPVGPAQAIVAGAWWLTREIELSCTRAIHVSLAGDPATAGALVATWHLPASKADARAAGVSRTHGCACGRGLG